MLLGFIIFLAFTSYDQSRSGAETEALTLVQQVENAQQFPAAVAPKLTGQLLCYARSVVGDEWPRMQNGTAGDSPNPWSLQLFRTLRTVQPVTASQQSAYDKWLDQTSTREEARRDRIHGAVGVIPFQLWIVLFFISAVIFVYMLFFADSGEPALTQGMLMGSVASVITVMLLLLGSLDQPVPLWRRRAEAGSDGTVAARAGRGAAVLRAGRKTALRRAGSPPLSGEPGSGRVALVATILLAVATVATAWSGYQASRWGAETTKATMRGTAARLESTRASGLANAQTQIDVAVFMQWVDAYASGNQRLRDFYFERFRPEFKPAVVAWLATRPLKNPNAPLTPFAMPQYKLEGARGGRAARGTGGRVGHHRATERAALDQLRARGRAVRHRALLRRDEHQAAHPAARRRDADDRHRRVRVDARVDRRVSDQRLRLTIYAESNPRSAASTRRGNVARL